MPLGKLVSSTNFPVSIHKYNGHVGNVCSKVPRTFQVSLHGDQLTLFLFLPLDNISQANYSLCHRVSLQPAFIRILFHKSSDLFSSQGITVLTFLLLDSTVEFNHLILSLFLTEFDGGLRISSILSILPEYVSFHFIVSLPLLSLQLSNLAKSLKQKEY